MKRSKRCAWAAVVVLSAYALGGCAATLEGENVPCSEDSCGPDETCDPTSGSCPPASERETFSSKADLVVTAISWTPEQPAPGDAVTLQATIRNQGTVASPSGVFHGVLFKVDEGTDSYFGCWSGSYAGPLAPGASVTVSADGGFNGATWTAAAGTHTIRAIVDDVNRMAESNEQNNDLSITLTVGQGGASDKPASSSILGPVDSSVGNPPGGSGTVVSKPGYFFVDSVSGSDNNNGTSPSSAWRSLAKVRSTAFQPGQVVHFKRGGSWSGGLVINSSGNSSSPITFTSYGSGAPPVFSSAQIMLDINADWVIVEGLAVRGGSTVGVQIRKGAEHNVVRHLEVTNAGNGVEIRGNHNLVTHCSIHDLHMVHNDPGGQDDYGATAVVLFASYNEVSYNKIYNCIASSYDYGVDGGAIEFYGYADNNNIHHNWAQHVDGFIETGAGSGGSCKNNIVAYNVSIDSNKKFACFHMGGSFQAVVDNFRMENNTIVLNPGSTCYQAILFNKGTPKASTLLFRNNILYTRNVDRVANADGFTHTNNLYYSETKSSWSAGISLTASEQRGNPRFVNLAASDLRLAAGSPAIEAGVTLGYTVDLDGHKLSCGAAPELGAYEHGCQ